MKTLSEWVIHCRDRLESATAGFGHGTDNATDEAAWLVLHAAGLPADQAPADWDAAVDEETGSRIQALLHRRINEAVPLAYLTGKAWFCGLEFEVTADVLVPRSPIAELILARFQPWLDPPGIGRVLDLCTGSGCIAIAIARHLPHTRVVAADLSMKALAVARRNVTRHQLGRRVELLQSNLFGSLRGKRFDLIVTNPPYVSQAEFDTLPAEYHAEPEIGLLSGDDGLDAVLDILATAVDYMREGATLVCEVGASRHALEEALPGVPFLWPDFEAGGSGVFILTRRDLLTASPAVKAVLEKRRHVR